jgi:hypothetical protein
VPSPSTAGSRNRPDLTDNSHALKRSRQQDDRNKRRKAAATPQTMIDAGEAVSFPAVARRAGVSVSLL